MTKEQTDKEFTPDDINMMAITETLTALTYTIQAQNAVILTLLHNAKRDPNFAIPDWESKEQVDAELGKTLSDCIDKVNTLYGQRETDKS